MSTHVARRRAAATATVLAVTAGSLAVGGVINSSYAAVPERSATTAVDTTYLADTLGLPSNTVVETVTYDRFQWLLQQTGQFAFIVGSPSADFKTKIQAADAAARDAGVSRLYWFDPNLSGFTGLKNLDTRNPAGITSIAPVSQGIYARTWQNVLAQYLGNGLKATGQGTGTITTAPDDTIVNDSVDPLWDYRTTPVAVPIAANDDVLFTYDKANTVSGVADKIVTGVKLTGNANSTADITAAFSTIGAANLDRVDQFEWWKSENNRRLTAQGPAEVYGQSVLEDSDKADGWKVQQLTYPELLHLLNVKEGTKNFVILFGGTWCPNTRAVIKDINEQAQLNDVTVYNFDTVLDGGVVGGGTTSSNNPIQIRNNAVYTSGGVTTTNYVPSYLYGDVVRNYLQNIVTENEPNKGSRILFYPGGDVTATPDVARRLQVPFLINYQRGTGTNVASNSIKRQWIQQNTDSSTGLPTFREYMSQVWYTRPEGTRFGLRNQDFPLSLPIPADPYAAPDSALLTPEEWASELTTPQQKATLATTRRNNIAREQGNVAFGQEAVGALKTFFGGLPGAVKSTQTVIAPTVPFGTAPKVNLAITNTFGRVPTGPATLTLGGANYSTPVAGNGASFTLPALSPGEYPYTVDYTGDAQILGFSKSGTLTVTEAKAASAVTATGASVTFGVAGTVSVAVPWVGGVAPTGDVTLSGVGDTQTKALTSGTATFSVANTLGVDVHNGTVTYAGDAAYFGSATPVTYSVAKAASTSKVTGTTVKFGAAGTVAVTFNAVAGVVPTGSVTLSGVGAWQTKPLANGKATFTVPAGLGAKVLTPKVTYAGDATFAGSTATGTYTVTKASVKSVGYSTTLRPTSAKTGKATVFITGQVGVGKPTGKVTVTLRQGSSVRTVTGTLANGQVSIVLPKLAKGTWTAQVVYAGDANYLWGKSGIAKFVVTA